MVPTVVMTGGTSGFGGCTASKPCAVSTGKALAARTVTVGEDVRANAYCRGQVFGTGLAARQSAPRRVVWSPAPLRRLLPTLSTAAVAGARLAELALRTATPPPRTALRRDAQGSSHLARALRLRA